MRISLSYPVLLPPFPPSQYSYSLGLVYYSLLTLLRLREYLQVTHMTHCSFISFLFIFLIFLVCVVLKHLLGYSQTDRNVNNLFCDQVYQVNLHFHFSVLDSVSPDSLFFLLQPRLMAKKCYVAVTLSTLPVDSCSSFGILSCHHFPVRSEEKCFRWQKTKHRGGVNVKVTQTQVAERG